MSLDLSHITHTRRGVVFDLDGVLVCTEPLKAEAHGAVVRQLGGSMTPDAALSIYQGVMGQQYEAVSQVFQSAGGIDVPAEQYSATYHRFYPDLLESHLETAPCVEPLLEALVRRGYLLGVASSTRAELLTGILTRTGLARFFSAGVSANDVVNKKPAPDAYQLALHRLDLSPDTVVVFEDSESGIRAAVAAGMPVVAVRHSLNGNHDFSAAQTIIDSLVDTGGVLQTIENLQSPADNDT